MSGWLARAVVRISAPLVPRELRARWREEWLGELHSNFEVRTSKFEVLRKSLGAPVDALSARVVSARQALRSLASGWRTDVVQTARHLWQQPRHALGVIASLTIGLTVSVTVFSAISGLLYGEISGVVDRKSLARVFISHEGVFGVEGFGRAGSMAASPLSISDFEILDADDGPSFTGVAAEGPRPVAASLDSVITGATAAFVSRQYFQVLGTQLLQGRFLKTSDFSSGATPVAVIGFHLWRDRFGAPADIVGRSIVIGGQHVTIVGVAPPRFTGVQPIDLGASPFDHVQLWLPLPLAGSLPGGVDRHQPWLTVVGRLTPGSSREQARASLGVAASRVAAASPDTRKGAMFLIRSHGFGPEEAPPRVLAVVALVLAIPLSVLTIACANVASLQLARATARARELSVRMALGASRGQLLRLLCLDTAMLTALAMLAAWLGAGMAVVAIRDVFPLSIELDRRVLLFALGLTAGVIVLSGIAPAWLVLRRRATSHLKPSNQVAGLAHPRLRYGLVVTQIAVSVVLLSASALLVRSVQAMRADVPEALREQLVAVIDLEALGYNAPRTRDFVASIRARFGADPRVRAAGAILDRQVRYGLPGRASDQWPFATVRLVTTSWLDTIASRLRSGRLPTQPGDVAISERLALDLSASGEPIGRVIEIASSSSPVIGSDGAMRIGRQDATRDAALRAVTVVGIVSDVRRRANDERPDPMIYQLMPDDMPGRFEFRIQAADPAALVTDVRQAIRELEPRLPWVDVQSGDAIYLREVGAIGYVAMSIGGLGTVGLFLACGGLYAVIAYVVVSRRREIGVRLAIGARPADVVSLIFRQAMRLAIAGVVIGLAVAVPTAFVLRSALTGISPVDPSGWLPPVLVSLLVAGVAGAWPASRAAQIDPALILRED